MSAEVDIVALCSSRGWSRTRLIRELREAAAAESVALPSDDSLKRMIRQWANGTRTPSDMYYRLLVRAFRIPDRSPASVVPEVVDRTGFAVDEGLVVALEAQTDSLRALDMRLGGARVTVQAEAHARTISDMVGWAPVGAVRLGLAAAGAEAAALVGWQVLDMGEGKAAWRWHDLARSLAKESEDRGIAAHVLAQQGYALLDAGRTAEAVDQMAAARAGADGAVPGVLAAWLAAAEAEARAANGERAEALRLLDLASTKLDDSRVPYIALEDTTLLRWRGHCLARLGEESAVNDLGSALSAVSPEWVRARAGLHTDMAVALSMRGERDAASGHAAQVRRLSATTGSVRQRDRLRRLVGDAEGEDVQQRHERS